MSLLGWLRGETNSDAEVRAEIWNLGVRHHGWALEGALRELEDADLPSDRAQLLRACVRKLRRDGAASGAS
jgi:hypothetical protein